MAADQSPRAGGVVVDGSPESMLLAGHDVPLGRYTKVRRLLPQRPRRLVGAWCFVDHFGPDDVTGTPGMRIPPHPHTGLQTVTWLVAGEILHRDSLGSQQSVRPGELNLMTAGHGIAHSEESPPDHPPHMHGLQLWVALPEPARHRAPAFAHHRAPPVLRDGDATITVVVGEVGGVRSPAEIHTALVGAEWYLPTGGGAGVPLRPDLEYAVLVMTGAATIDDARLDPGALLYLGAGRTELVIHSEQPTRLFLLGGEPFEEPLVMWWNFVGRSHEEIAQARADWQAGERFGPVTGYRGDPLPAPAMPTSRLLARDRHGHRVV